MRYITDQSNRKFVTISSVNLELTKILLNIREIRGRKSHVIRINIPQRWWRCIFTWDAKSGKGMQDHLLNHFGSNKSSSRRRWWLWRHEWWRNGGQRCGIRRWSSSMISTRVTILWPFSALRYDMICSLTVIAEFPFALRREMRYFLHL